MLLLYKPRVRLVFTDVFLFSVPVDEFLPADEFVPENESEPNTESRDESDGEEEGDNGVDL